MKIVYSLNSIRGQGGVERITLIVANALAQIDGNEVFIVVADNKSLEQVFEISPLIHLVDLNVNSHEWNPSFPDLINNMISWTTKPRHRSLLRNALKKITPDIVITCGKTDKYLFPSKWKRQWKLVRIFHEEKYIEIKNSPTKFLKWMTRVLIFLDHLINVPKCDRIIVLTHEEKERNWQGKKNVLIIPNPVTFSCETPSSLNQKCVISVGRLDRLKNYSALINAFKIVCERHNDWCLNIYGDGPEKQHLQQQINDLGLQNNVYLMGFIKDIRTVMLQSSIFGFSSLCEGLPLVLIEAMECGLPVVSYQCANGPKDIITDGVNGFLVPVGDEKMLADKICTIIEDKELHHKMGLAAKANAQNYQLDHIANQWMSLFYELTSA